MEPDMLFEVFLRLPIESILTCKCVCKSWLRVIQDPIFVEQQRRLSVPRALVQTIVQTITPEPVDTKVYLVDCEAHKGRPLRGARALKMLNRGYEIMSTCDGLLCIALDHKQFPVFLYNPLLNRAQKLPSNGFKKKLRWHEAGLIFHKSSGTYKVVRCYCSGIMGQSMRDDVFKFEMITLGESVWTELNPPSLASKCIFARPVQWNGGIHWRIKCHWGEPWGDEIILSFDVNKEVFQVVYCKDRPQSNPSQLLVLDEELVLVETHNRSQMKMWKVEGNAIGEYSINGFTLWKSNMQRRGYFTCLLVSETTDDDDTYLLHTMHAKRTEIFFKSDLVKFSPKTESYSELNLSGMPNHFSTIAYRPTLVSPICPRSNAPRSIADGQEEADRPTLTDT